MLPICLFLKFLDTSKVKVHDTGVAPGFYSLIRGYLSIHAITGTFDVHMPSNNTYKNRLQKRFSDGLRMNPSKYSPSHNVVHPPPPMSIYSRFMSPIKLFDAFDNPEGFFLSIRPGIRSSPSQLMPSTRRAFALSPVERAGA